jgi:carbon monoxide dehydrogenase subunit G
MHRKFNAMIKLESKTRTVNGSREEVYKYITDFRNFSDLLPADKLRNLEVSSDSLSFGIDGLGNIGLVIAEKTPYEHIHITATEKSTADFNFNINLTEAPGNQSEVKINLQANLNMFLEMMAKGPLQQFVDLIIDKLALTDFKK